MAGPIFGKEKETKTWLIAGFSLLAVAILLVFLISPGLLQLSPSSSEKTYYYENSQVKTSFELDPSSVGEDSTSEDKYAIIYASAITVKGSSTDSELHSLRKNIDGTSGDCGIAGVNCVIPDSFESLFVKDWKVPSELENDLDDFFDKSDKKSKGIGPGGDKVELDLQVPGVSGTNTVFRVYTVKCDLGRSWTDEYSCEATVDEIVGITKDFCGTIEGYSQPEQPSDYSSWDNYCYSEHSGPHYCDSENNKCIPACESCYGDKYCLADKTNDGDQLADLLDRIDQLGETGGTAGCVQEDKICKQSEDCTVSGDSSGDREYPAERCEKEDIPSWLEEVNKEVYSGSFGVCEEGCELSGDCTATIGDADDFFVNAFDDSVRGESWTCQQDGDCRLNICNHNTDCWSLQKTQMSKCKSGTCERITCNDHYDCWNEVIIEGTLNNYMYGCKDEVCQYAEWSDDVTEERLTPSLCEAAFGVPEDGSAWTVSDGECSEKEIIDDQCDVGADQDKVEEQCTSLEGEPTEGYRWECIGTNIEGQTKGTCNEVEIPVTEDCQSADNPDEYCMYENGVGTLQRGKQWKCTPRGVCVLADATCNSDSDCKVGSIGGTCIDGLCQYGDTTPPQPPATCGDGVCQANENKSNCIEDCGDTGQDFQWNKLYWIPILFTIGMSLVFGLREKKRTGRYNTGQFIIGAIIGAVGGIILYFIFKNLLATFLISLLGVGGVIAIILVVGGAPLLWYLLSKVTGGRSERVRGSVRPYRQYGWRPQRRRY